MTKIVNLTPHEIVLYSMDKQTILANYPPSGMVARVSEITKEDKESSHLFGIPIAIKEYGEIENLPKFHFDINEEEKSFNTNPEALYIVSVMVLSATNYSDNPHIIAPDTGSGAVRDDKGVLLGTTRFVSNPF
jgi:hypothetical protein